MNFQILASTNFDNENIKNRFDEFSGELAGICYMQSDLKTIQDSELSKKLKRTNMIKKMDITAFLTTNISLYILKMCQSFLQ